MDKKEFRKEKIAIRNGIPISEKNKFDKEITDKILSLKEFKNAENILLFATTGSEFQTKLIFELSREQNKNLYFPKCLKNFKMSFYKINDLSEMKSGMYGILEPEEAEIYNNFSATDLIIVPALSVDKSFNRIGYGKGYYDRFLKDFKGVSVCPIYPELISKEVPTGQFDIPLDIIITPSEIYRR